MKAVIIAAGMGTRLSRISGELPKPLTPVCGAPLLARIICVCREAGIGEFVLVVGYMAGALKNYFADGKRLQVKIDYIFNPDWQRANGISALKAKKLVGSEETFLLLMSDHLFNRQMLDHLLADTSGKNLLAVDKAVDKIFDLPDATKVLCQGTVIRDIGKEISRYNGIDCGMFRLKANFFNAMETAISQGRESLSDGVRELIAQDDFAASFISPAAKWLDVDTEEAFRYAEEHIEWFS